MGRAPQRWIMARQLVRGSVHSRISNHSMVLTELGMVALTRALPVQLIPWFPTDPAELAQQDANLEATGMRLRHQLGHLRGRGGVVAGRGRGLPKRGRPVNIPGFR